MTDTTLYRLLAWLSPAYPVGAFSYSHGLEAAVDSGSVGCAATLRGWLEVLVSIGGLSVDLLLFRRAWEAASAGDASAWQAINTEALARRGSAETAFESRQQGRSFLQVTRAAWPGSGLDRLFSDSDTESIGPLAYAAIVAAASAPAIPVRSALLAYGQAFVANLVSAGVRLIPLGQTDGQRVLAALETTVRDAVDRALAAPTGTDPATAAPMLELQSMHHETQYTRLFRS